MLVLARLILIGWRSAETRHGATTHSTMLRFLKHFSILNVYEGLCRHGFYHTICTYITRTAFIVYSVHFVKTIR